MGKIIHHDPKLAVPAAMAPCQINVCHLMVLDDAALLRLDGVPEALRLHVHPHDHYWYFVRVSIRY